MKPLLLTALLVTLSGCSTVARIVDYGAAANDEVVDSSVFAICQAASIGAVRRKFDTPEKIETWQRLCSSDSDFNPSTANRQP